MERQPLQSSNLASAGYDAAARVLEIEFHDGAVWQYAAVPAAIYTSLLVASSAGQYFHAAIRDSFVGTQITPGRRGRR